MEITHENILKAYDYFMLDKDGEKSHCLILDFCEGGELQKRQL
jgi:hypothetical protein